MPLFTDLRGRYVSFRHPFVPPSSEAALRDLADSVMHHYIDNQCPAALAAALTFPFLGDRSAKLPLPNTTSQSILPPARCTLVTRAGCMSFSAALSSTLKPPATLSVPGSNQSWKSSTRLVKTGDFESVAVSHHCRHYGRRQPKLAALWMRAAISGVADYFLRCVNLGLAAIEFDAAAWTGTTNSFISLVPDDRPGLEEEEDRELPRSDECRLLFLTDAEGHSRIPICPCNS
ncbi:hypothetical protein MBM_00114 [Drepanopeziza brunnea f. sp. 'multigermtubi' MB_m1]|uniref:Uncharacterized protein n=1 Tax=Marssonina brunnea f. sp. multigermtubi (strain MB_m1) TaxID=1072389 RepID=K1X7C0_MARBU|nr:uncharacterized protein MBM_00114 [Drepanopeziza brunnea f. sp. 'multigermtubi' MB_m1]EKD21001.1 hypothetical protein MBM_00114 [Drepanopeziza brunnea f. sp. 'multigermtubi' MB_m1]